MELRERVEQLVQDQLQMKDVGVAHPAVPVLDGGCAAAVDFSGEKTRLSDKYTSNRQLELLAAHSLIRHDRSLALEQAFNQGTVQTLQALESDNLRSIQQSIENECEVLTAQSQALQAEHNNMVKTNARIESHLIGRIRDTLDEQFV